MSRGRRAKRGFLRARLKPRMPREIAARVLQRLFRGVAGRRLCASKKRLLAERRLRGASAIAGCYRCCRAVCELKRRRRHCEEKLASRKRAVARVGVQNIVLFQLLRRAWVERPV